MSTEIPPSNAIGEGMPAPDPGAQWLQAHLSFRPELRFDVRHRADGSFVVIEDPIRGKFFQVGLDEYRFIASLNGKTTVAEVVNKLNRTNHDFIDPEKATTMCQWLVNSNLVIGHDLDNSKRLRLQARAITNQQLMGLLNPICFRVRLFNPNRALEAIQPYVQWWFSWGFAILWATVAVFALKEVVENWDAIGDASLGILAGGKWLWLLLVWTVLKIVHETAHGVACRKYGGEVPDAGVLLLLFTPMAFVSVTSSWRFSNRWHRIVVAAAGMYVELFISFLAVLIWAGAGPGIVKDICFNIFVMASITTVLFNANPLMRFDGYYILSDVLNVPNLYAKGTKWFGELLKTTLFGTEVTPNICHPNEQIPVRIYGVLAFFWKILISLSLIIGASVLFHGAGIALAVIGIALWFGVPIYKLLNSIFGPKPTHPPNFRRVVLSSVVLAVIGVCLFTILRGPATKSAPAIVQFKDEQPIRADVDGFVKTIAIQDGQIVLQDEVLIELENPELESELCQLQLQSEETAIQRRIYQKTGETALAQAEQEKHEGLLAQIKEKRNQLQGLVVRAPYDGFVFQRNLENRLGSFVHRGDELLHIANPETKEIVVSIDQVDLESIKENEGRQLRVAFPGLAVFESELTRIDPRANERPTHPSLCAHVGGPLPVRQTEDARNDQNASVLLLSPRFTAELTLSDAEAKSLQSGQRGRAFFSTRRQSLGSYLYLAIANWFEGKLEQATVTSVF